MILHNIQALRAAAALLVFLVHYEDLEQKRGGYRLFGEWADAGAAGVDLFFAISGFVMVLTTKDIVGHPSAAWRFLYARVARIYPLWWVCLTALAFVWLVRPGLVYGGSAGFEPDFVRDYLLIVREDSPLLQVGWTLIYEMHFYLLFGLLLLLPMDLERRAQALAVWAALVVAGAVAADLGGGIGGGTQLFIALSPLNLEFLAGAAAAYCHIRHGGRLAGLALGVGVAAFAVGLVLFADPASATLFEGSTWSREWLRATLFTLPAFLIVYGASGLEVRERLCAWRPLARVGDWSYSLYLTHMLTLGLLGLLWARVPWDGAASRVVAFVVVLAACLAVSALSFRLVEIPAARLLRRWRDGLRMKRPAT